MENIVNFGLFHLYPLGLNNDLHSYLWLLLKYLVKVKLKYLTIQLGNFHGYFVRVEFLISLRLRIVIHLKI